MSSDLKIIEAHPTMLLSPMPFSEADKRLILDTCCQGASEPEAKILIGIAQARGLNPLLGDCYFVKRWDGQKGRDIWAVQASIDSFRMKAQDTGDYAGQDEPEFEYAPDDRERRTPLVARVRVYRKSVPGRPFAVGVAYWREYVQTKKDGSPTKFWQTMGHNQLAKCAEALALRKAFPRELSKIYAKEEMDQSNNALREEGVPSGRMSQADNMDIEYGEPETVAQPAERRELGEAAPKTRKSRAAASPASAPKSAPGPLQELGRRILEVKPQFTGDKTKVREWIAGVVGHPYDGDSVVLTEKEIALLHKELDADEMFTDKPQASGEDAL